MECPKCKKKMKLVAKDFSYNYKIKPVVKYLRSINWCKKDDVWISVEVPKIK